MDVSCLTIQSFHNDLQELNCTYEEVVESYLDRINKYNLELNAVLTINESVINQAVQLDKKKTTRSRKTPLLGVPIILKDNYMTENLRTTAGSKVLESFIPKYDATVVQKLKHAGALILGKANLDAWAHGSSGENSDFGPTKNPYNLEYTPGGSSSGSGCSVASCLCLGATGSDTGSSIRLPASFCNLVGMKPTYGRISRYGIIAMGSSFDCPGPLTKSVYDNALMLSVMAGHDINDATSSKNQVPLYTKNIDKSIKGLKIGIIKEFFTKGLDMSVKDKINEAIDVLKDLGAKVSFVSLPILDYAIAVYYILVPAEISSNLNRFDGIRYGNNRDKFTDEAKRRIMIGTYTLSSGYYDAYYKKALKVRRLIKEDFDKAFNKVDILLGPTSPTLPFKLGEKTDDPLSMYLSDIYVCPMNLAGVPALNIPVKPTKGFPVGMQLVGRQFDEGLLYRVGYAYENVRGPIELPLAI